MSRRNFAIVFFAVIIAFPLFGESTAVASSSGPRAATKHEAGRTPVTTLLISRDVLVP